MSALSGKAGRGTGKTVTLSQEVLREHEKIKGSKNLPHAQTQRKISVISPSSNKSGNSATASNCLSMPQTQTRKKSSVASNKSWSGPPAVAYVPTRRRSSLKSYVLSHMAARRKSRYNIPKVETPKVRLENTYKVEPDDNAVFNCQKIQNIIETVLEAQLKDEKYDARMCRSLTKDVSNIIKDRLKHMEMPRYKLVVSVMLGECGDQCLQLASRSIWNDKTDKSVTGTYQNEHLFAVCTVYGVYFE